MSDLLAHARRIQAATIFRSKFVEPETCPSLEAAHARLKVEAQGRPLTFTPGRAAYPDLADFWCLTVRAAGDSIAYLADRWHDEADMAAALAVLRACEAAHAERAAA